MVKNAQTICWLLPMNCLSVFEYFLGLALKGLNFNKSQPIYTCKHSPHKKEYMSIDFSFWRPECQVLVAPEMFKALAVLSQLSITCNLSMKLDVSIGCNEAVTCCTLQCANCTATTVIFYKFFWYKIIFFSNLDKKVLHHHLDFI